MKEIQEVSVKLYIEQISGLIDTLQIIAHKLDSLYSDPYSSSDFDELAEIDALRRAVVDHRALLMRVTERSYKTVSMQRFTFELIKSTDVREEAEMVVMARTEREARSKANELLEVEKDNIIWTRVADRPYYEVGDLEVEEGGCDDNGND